MGTQSPTLVSPLMAVIAILALPRASPRGSGCIGVSCPGHGGVWWLVVVLSGGGRWCGVLQGPVSLACEVTLSLSPRLNLPWHKTSCPGWQLILGGSV